MSLISTLLFPVPPPSYSYHSFPNELLWIPFGVDYETCRAGDCIPGILLPSPAARYFVIYFHSNGEDIGLCHSFGAGLRMVLEVHVLLVEYPGYGICPGQCSEESLWRTALAAHKFVTEVLHWPAEDVILMGRSLGSAVATRLACSVPCHGLILVAPFLSLVDAVSQYVGGLAPMLVNNMFSNRDCICKVEVPTLIIHGQQDRLVPCSQGKMLYDLCAHHKKLYVSPEDMGHNSDLLSNADFLIRPMLRLFSLPDYHFVDLTVPPEAFNKRLCPQYHGLVEMTKQDAPLVRLLGDVEPCPTCTTTEGPQCGALNLPWAAGDLDGLEGSNEYTVRTPRAAARRNLEGNQGIQSNAWPEGVEARDLLVAELTAGTDNGSDGQGRPIVAAVAAPVTATPPDDSLDSQSTTVDSSTLRQSDSSNTGGEDGFSLPGLQLLDLDHGISCFLGETRHEIATIPAA